MELPRTIKGAMHIARKLDIEYLCWVDALCVRQGQDERDKADRAYHLSGMGAIYRQALVTIVAASGEDANAGLSGIRRGSRRKQQVVEVIPRDEGNKLGMALVATCDSPPVWTGWNKDFSSTDSELDSSHWNTRGWTFQESALSRRCLAKQVLWVCDGAVFCEKSQYEHPAIFQKSDLDTPLRLEPSQDLTGHCLGRPSMGH
ncbi:hypothetical protein VPNG_02699 [Cytospora leucostoma]|uniref:Heterokaryon incompatibility domain-containing protein n=1 Tax=Cytospora leucostoma TaxID=1230097 RepID=A0A423XJE4_9PEZI|nr:hypothetical protein VPNG_02699 [Cytospora leucostoma]